MKKPSFADIQEQLNNVDMSQLSPLRISVLRNIILEPVEPYIRHLAFQMDFNAQVQFGEYDNIFQEAVGGNEMLLNKDTAFVLVFMRLESVSWDLANAFAGLSSKNIRSEVDRIKTLIATVISAIRRQADAVILWHGFEVPVNPSFGVLDRQINTGQCAVIRELNDLLLSTLQSIANAYYVDLNSCLSRVGARSFYDLRYWHIGRAPYSLQGLYEIAFEDFKFIRALKGKNKKCLVLDCDSILWGGIVGEDGLAGIKLGKTYPGSAYYEFQEQVLNLYNRGIILALCSKNNEEDVWEVFRSHPDMVLKEEHIATAQINWHDKATNLRQISSDLNIGLDSMVFIDDSEFEVNLIRETLPEVEVIHMPETRAVEYRDILASCGLFDTLTLTAEDKKRGAMYKAEASRMKIKTNATDMKSYYKSLEMILEIHFADEFAVPRIAQLTQKTNQFNLTTRRYSESDINNLANSDSSDVIYARLKDKFGDSGIVGVCILKYENERAIFDSFLLSCRVLGRCVEDAFLIQAIKLAKHRGCKVAFGEYYATRKNIQVKNFYVRQGFKMYKKNSKCAGINFKYDLKEKTRSEPEFFKKIDSQLDR